MITDETKDDEILEDDFDIDDFEDDWDEEQDDAIDSAPNDATEAPPAGQKTFLQKFFLPIVIVVVALFAGIFVVGQGFLSGAAPDTDPAEENALPTAEEDMAADVSSDVTVVSGAEDFAVNTETTPDPLPVASEDSTLRPLPGEEASEQIELADLEAELSESNDNILSNETLDFLDENPLPETSPAPQEEADILLEEPAEILAQPVSGSDTESLPFNDTAELTSNDDEAVLDDILAADPVSNGSDDVQITSEEGALEAMPVSTTPEDTSELSSQIATLEAENASLTATISDNESTIASLNTQIQDLKNALEAMEKKEDAAPAAQPPTPKQQKKPADAPTAAVEPLVSKQPIKKSMPKWKLKSAQPGRATLAPSDSNDLKTVEIGDVVSGLGRITNIGLENNRWVVRGTKGEITQ